MKEVYFQRVDLDLPQYIGVARSIKDPYGFQRNEFRIDYSGHCDVGVQIIDILPLTARHETRPQRIIISQIEKGRESDYTQIVLDRNIEQINEKVTQLIIFYSNLIKQVQNFSIQINKQLKISAKTVPNIDLNDHSQLLLTNIEHYFYLLNSTLDLIANFSSIFNKKAPKKIGQQLHESLEKKLVWDNEYQVFLLSQDKFKTWLNTYRNTLAHKASLKFRFKKVDLNWLTIISYDYYSKEGLVIPESIEALHESFLNFVSFVDKHFSEKVPRLNKLVSENSL